MLAPGQIKGYQFQSAGQDVYRADEVDNFIEAVSSAYEKIYNENGDLIKRINLLADKVKAYQEQEELIKKTLLIAQKQADELEKSSKERSEELISGAEKQYNEKSAAAEKRAKDLLAAAEERARKILSEANQHSADTLHGASATAEKTVSTARGKAAMILAEAKNKAEKMLSDAQNRSNEILGSLKGEVENEKKALDTVRAQSREFKKRITESYYEQIGMATQLLSFVDGEDAVVQNAIQAAQNVPAVEKPESVTIPQYDVEPQVELPDTDTYLQDDDDLFTSVLEELVSEDEPAAQSEPQIEDISSFSTPEAEEASEKPEQGFSFVNGFGEFGESISTPDADTEIEEVPVAEINDIFSSALSQSPEEPQPAAAPVEEENAAPLRDLKEKYASTPVQPPQPQQSEFGGFSARMNDMLPDEQPEPPTRAVPLRQLEEEPEPRDEEKPEKPAKPEKKRHRLSLFSRYEDDEDEDEDDDDYDEDDEDDDEDDEEDGGFRGFFRKS